MIKLKDHQKQTILTFRAFPQHVPIVSSSPLSPLSCSLCSLLIKLDDTAQGSNTFPYKSISINVTIQKHCNHHGHCHNPRSALQEHVGHQHQHQHHRQHQHQRHLKMTDSSTSNYEKTQFFRHANCVRHAKCVCHKKAGLPPRLTLRSGAAKF